MNLIPITKPSRPVQKRDLWRVFKDSCRIKWAMLFPFPGRYPRAAAIAHPQITADDPLQFFVVHKEGKHRLDFPFGAFTGFGGRTIINPKIVSKGTVANRNKEGCMSYPHEKLKRVQRFETVEVEYQTLWMAVLFMKWRITRKFHFFRAAICQHEIEHFEGRDIYPLTNYRRGLS